MRNPLIIATIFIALYAISMGISAQNVYRCGNTYSQTPCAGEGKTLNTTSPNAAATLARKQAADKESKRQMEVAKAMEKARLTQDAEARRFHHAQAQAIEHERIKAATSPVGGASSAQAQSKNKKSSEFFTAKQIPAAKP